MRFKQCFVNCTTEMHVSCLFANQHMLSAPVKMMAICKQFFFPTYLPSDHMQ